MNNQPRPSEDPGTTPNRQGLNSTPDSLTAQTIAADASTIQQIVQSESVPIETIPTIPGYEILGIVGEGGMGTVYRARQTNLDRIVAIKVIRANSTASVAQRFEEEARTVAKLRHPNLVAAYDFGESNGQWFFVMEYLEGSTLLQHIEQSNGTPELDAWKLIRQAAAGLAHADAQGVIHLDIKPANLLLVEPPVGLGFDPAIPMVKVTDFGLSRLTQFQSDTTPEATQISGTPIYMSPEQVRKEPLDRTSDIYALGFTAIHLLTGQVPFKGMNIWEILAEKGKGLVQTLPESLSPGSTELIRRMIDPNKQNRLANYAELINQINDLVTTLETKATESQQSDAKKEPGSRPTVRSASFRRWLIPIASAVSLLAVASVVWLNRSPGSVPFDTRNWSPTGKSQLLLTPGSIDGWSIQSGQWTEDLDEEKNRVFKGTRGIARRTYTTWPTQRIILHLDAHALTACEIQFANDSKRAGKLGLRLSPKEGASLVSRAPDGSSITSLSPKTLIAGSEEREGQVPYIEIRIDMINGQCQAKVDNQVIGTAPYKLEPEGELRLIIEGGSAVWEVIAAEQLSLATSPR